MVQLIVELQEVHGVIIFITILKILKYLKLQQKNHNLKWLDLIKIPIIELYVMVQEIMDIQENHVLKHVVNINISHYKMVTVKLVNVSVIMI